MILWQKASTLASLNAITNPDTADNTMKNTLLKNLFISLFLLGVSLPALSAQAPYAFKKVAKNVWVMHGPLEQPNPDNKGFMNNPGVVKTSAGLVIIDPGSSLQTGEMVLAAAKKISNDAVVAVFDTHVHGDHWLGNQAILEAYPNVKIYAHPEMIKEVNAGEGDHWVALMETLTKGATKGTKVIAPNTAVKHGDVIKIGQTHFRIYHYGQAHTKTDIMIDVVEDKTVFLGDNVLADRIPRMSDGSFQGSINACDKILEVNASTWVPGHGPTGSSDIIKNYRHYLSLIYAAAKKAFDDDLDSSDVIAISRKTTTAYKGWAGYDDELGKHGAQAYEEIEAAEF